MLEGKHILLGVTGSIAAYKSASLASDLVKQGAVVTVVMTKNATNFINPITFETLTGRKCLIDTFDRNFEYSVEHVSLAKETELVMIAPASANIIGKLANGIADDMLTTTVMACRCPIFVAPAMNTAMYENAIVTDNLAKLRRFGIQVIEPASGYLACGDTGKGKMPEPAKLASCIRHAIGHSKDLEGKKVLITSGPTREAIDPVRFITNHSTGKMGFAIANNASMRGAEVTVVSGRVSVEPPDFAEVLFVDSAAQMAAEVRERAADADIIICCAAVADMTPVAVANDKIKKSDFDGCLKLKPTEDILAWAGANRRKGQVIAGFSMETRDLAVNSRAKLESKHIDMIVGNNVKVEGAGFGTDTNVVTFITRDEAVELPIMSKDMVAEKLLDKIKEISE